MNTYAKKTIIGLSIASALVTSCSAKQEMTKATDEAPSTTQTTVMQTKPDTTLALSPLNPIEHNQPPKNTHEPVPIKVAQTASTECGKHQFNNDGKPEDSVTIRVTGYGAPPKAFYPDPQRRLMAMRAAKIDAYRSLAERVTGIQIWGGTTIGDMVVEKDRFRVYIDTYITGARVIAENPLDDGTFETVVELSVGQSFLNKTLPQKTNEDCMKSAMTSDNPSRNQLYLAEKGSTIKPGIY